MDRGGARTSQPDHVVLDEGELLDLAAEEGRADVGVLFVHGIGEHAAGSTLEHMGHALAEHVTRGEDGGDATTVHSEVVDVHVRGATWRLAEANWDEQLEEPSVRETIVWLVLVTPWALQRELLFWRLRRPSGSLALSSAGALLRTFTSIGGVLRLFASILLGPLLQVALLAVALLRWVPGASRIVRTLLQRVLGDSYLFLTEPDVADAMADTVADRLGELSRTCDRTVLVAHSQGAAVSAHALTRRPAPPTFARLITLGAGIGKLTAMREVVDRTAWLAGWLVLRLALLPVVFGFGSTAVAAGTWRESLGPAAYLVLGIGPLLGTWTGRRAVADRLAAIPGLGQWWSWIDVWSSRDLVPDGALHTPPSLVGNGVVSVEVSNVERPRWRAWLVDHVAYLENDAQVLPLLDAAISQVATDAGTHPWVPLAIARRRGVDLGHVPDEVRAGVSSLLAAGADGEDDGPAVLERLAVALAPVGPPPPGAGDRRSLPRGLTSSLLVAANVAVVVAGLVVLADAQRATEGAVSPSFAAVESLLSEGAQAVGALALTVAMATLFRHGGRRPMLQRAAHGYAFGVLVLALVVGGTLWQRVTPISETSYGDCFWPRDPTGVPDEATPDVVLVPCDEQHRGQVVGQLPPLPALDDASLQLRLDECNAMAMPRGVTFEQVRIEYFFAPDAGTTAQTVPVTCMAWHQPPVAGGVLPAAP